MKSNSPAASRAVFSRQYQINATLSAPRIPIRKGMFSPREWFHPMGAVCQKRQDW